VEEDLTEKLALKVNRFGVSVSYLINFWTPNICMTVQQLTLIHCHTSSQRYLLDI
jgi:hypothetical protein